MMPVKVIPKFFDMAYGARYHTSIVKAILGNVNVSRIGARQNQVGDIRRVSE